jgi:5-methylcytosine-specific restriction endonuclease McrA
MKNPWMKFFTSDWRGDARLRMCSLTARGLWIEMMCVMHEAEPYGSLTINGKPISEQQLASLVGDTKKAVVDCLRELEEASVFSREGDVIFSRRMRRDAEKAGKNKTNGVLGGNPEIRRGSVPKDQRVRPFKRSDAPQKTRRIFEKSDGRCYWCRVDLIWQWDGVGEQPANIFHIDHVVPVCDGGTNDEDNLVAACAACNHDRARVFPTASRG